MFTVLVPHDWLLSVSWFFFLSYRIKKYLLKLSAIPLKTIRYDFGSGIHYAGTIPMGQGDTFPVSKFGEVKFMKDLHICDASILPSLPSKPVSANAASIGHYVARNI